MSLVTVFFPKKAEPKYRKAIIDSKEVDFFLAKGAYRLAADAQKAVTSAIEPDKAAATPALEPKKAK